MSKHLGSDESVAGAKREALGIDIGTQSVKALRVDIGSGKVVGRGAAGLTLSSPRLGAAEQNPQDWITAMECALRQAGDLSGVVCIGVSGQQHGCVVLDEKDQPVRPAKLWCDTEAAAEAAELSTAFGRVVPSGFTAPKVLWMKRREPELFARARRVLLPHDWINLHLTGRACTDAGDASGTGYFDPCKRRYDEAALNAIDSRLAAMIPNVIGANESVGVVQSAVAGRLGLGSGVVVSVGSGDNMCSALGAGAVDDGALVLSLGTSGTVYCVSDHPVSDSEGDFALFCDATGKWLPLLCTMNCTGATEELCCAFAKSHEELTQLALAEPVGSHGVRFIPYLRGERSPNWPHACGVIHGLRPGLMRPGVLYRAAIEGAACGLFRGVERLRALGAKANSIRLVGGAARNQVWRETLVDLCGMRVHVPLEQESAALGAALQAAAVHGGGDVAEFIHTHQPEMELLPDEPRRSNTEQLHAVAAEITDLGKALFAG